MFTKLYRLTIITALLVFVLGTFMNAQAAPLPQTHTLIWSDEFSGTTLSSAWVTCHWWSNLYCTSQPNNELQLYTPNNVAVGGGVLNLHADRQASPINYCDRDCRNYNYTSGLIQTDGNDHGAPVGFTFTYGYAEARMKIPTGKSTFPAFWLWPASRQDPPEIDIMEVLGDAPNTVYMTYKPGGSYSQGVWKGVDFSQDYHLFAVDWQPNVIIWYVDGVERYRWTGTTLNKPMYPILNLAIGGNWAGAPDANTVFPANLLVDYVRVYANDYTVGVSTPATPTKLPATATSALTVTPTHLPPTPTFIAPTATPTQLPATATTAPVATSTTAPATATSIPATPTLAAPTATPTQLPATATTVPAATSTEAPATPTNIPATPTAAAPVATATAVPPTATQPAPSNPQPSRAVRVQIDNTDAAVVYSSGWGEIKSKKAFDGSYKQTSSHNSTVTFTFTGVGFGLLYTAGSGYGSLDIYLDDVRVGTLNERSARNRYQQIWNYRTHFPSGQHKLRLVYSGTEPAPITLDGFFVIQLTQ